MGNVFSITEGAAPDPPDCPAYDMHYFQSCCWRIDRSFVVLLVQIILSMILIAFAVGMLIYHSIQNNMPGMTDIYVSIISLIFGYWIGLPFSNLVTGKMKAAEEN